VSYAAASTDLAYTWWKRDAADEQDPRAHLKLIEIVKRLQREQAYRKRADLLHGAMYGDVPLQGLNQDAYTRTTPGGESTLSLNVTRNVVDAVVSRVYAKSDPHLTYGTEGGDYEKQHEAEQLERGVDGTFYQTEFYRKAASAGRNGAIFGTGLLRVEPDWDRRQVSVKRYKPWEMVVDDSETVYDDCLESSIPNFYACTYRDKYRLLYLVQHHLREMGGAAEDADTICNQIERMQGERDDDAEFGYQNRACRIALYEGWHYPSGMGADDGRYVMAVGNVAIIDAKWNPEERPWPFAAYRWSEPVAGWYGQGLVEQGKGIQREINFLIRQFQQGHHLISGGWMVEASSKVISAHINNDLARILRYTGKAPEYVAPVVIEPAKYQHLWNLVSQYYKLASLNEQAVHAERPAGVDSGEAQRVYAEQQDVTLLQRGKDYERFVKDAGHLCVMAAKQLADDGGYEVRAQADDGFETIDWGSLKDPKGFEAKVTATSSLPSTLTGKIQTGFDLLKLGTIDSMDVTELIMPGMGDTLMLTKLKTAWRRRVEKDVGIMLRLGEAKLPDPFLNVYSAIELVTAHYNLAVTKDVEDDRLQLLRDYLVELDKLKPKPLPQQAMMPGGQGLMAPGTPSPLMPVSGTQQQPQSAPPPPGANGAPPPGMAA
jgi:hypothetical protein